MNNNQAEENDQIVQREKSVTVVISRRILPGHEKDYDEWVRKLVTAATEAPGNTGATLLIPETGKPGLHHVVLRFADNDSVHRWEDSYIRQKLSHEADAFSVRTRQEATGLETWFSIPECPELAPPSRWKMFIITTMGVYILSVIFVKMLEVINLGWNFYFENILLSALVVGSLTWAVMPWFSRRVFRKWLYRE
jgi:antibiotic biosynthesis monooxygenase (ABM) superfamily enzyme